MILEGKLLMGLPSIEVYKFWILYLKKLSEKSEITETQSKSFPLKESKDDDYCFKPE